jgi:hypothetical protein
VGYVSNQPLREAWEASGLSLSELARRMGYVYISKKDGGERPNDAAIQAALGLKRCKIRGKSPHWTIQKRMREDTALRYLEAMHLDPVDVGL